MTENGKPAPEGGKERKPGEVSKLRRRIGLVVCVLAFSVLAAFLMGRFRTFRVISDSMMPTVLIGDLILVDGRTPIAPERGDIVAVKNPQDASDWLCKRVVAVPLDEVRVEHGTLYINGKSQDDEPYVMSHYIPLTKPYGPVKMDVDTYFVLGDNRQLSYDSLDFGPVRASDFIGKAIGIYWPPSRVRSLRAVSLPK